VPNTKKELPTSVRKPQRQKASNAVDVEARLKNLRLDRGMTLQQLAEKADLTRGYLSLVERGIKTPSIAALIRLANALNVNVAELLGGEPLDTPSFAISRRHPRANAPADAATDIRMSFEALVPGLLKKSMDPFLVHPPDVGAASNTHQGEEFVFVVRGTVELLLNGKATKLDTGDCAYFNAHTPHKFRNIGQQQSEVLVVIGNSGKKTE
jgi:transcriptional regulator with XRE-family HTH domain